jgi:cytochrome c556
MKFRSCAAILVLGLLVVAGRSGSASAPLAGEAQAAAKMSVEQHEKTMKAMAQANQGVQKGLKSNDLAAAAKGAQEMATLAGDVERFWTQHNKPDAVKVAQSLRAAVTEVAGAAAAGDQKKAMAAAQNIGANCKQCHSTYREGNPEIGYSIKPGTI